MRVLSGIVWACLPLACGSVKKSQPGADLCALGSKRGCACPDTTEGEQTCGADGKFASCVCDDGATASTSSAGVGGAAGASSATMSTTGSQTSSTTLTGAGGGASDFEEACPMATEELNCITSAKSYSATKRNVLVVLDASASMLEQSNGLEKWAATRDALQTALSRAGDRIDFGLELFPTPATPGQTIGRLDCGAQGTCCEMPSHIEMNVPISADALSDIVSSIEQTTPAGHTPTARALERALEYFETGEGAQLSGDKFVLLVSDGGPNCNDALSCGIEQCTYNLDHPVVDCISVVADNNCCAISGTHGCLDSDQTAAQIEQLASAGISTVVVGLPGSDPYSTLFNQLAMLGRQSLPAADESYYRVSDLAQLGGVFEAALLSVNCSIDLESPNGSVPSVFLDCAQVFRDADWLWESAGELRLLGPTCEAFATATHRLDVLTLVCGAQ